MRNTRSGDSRNILRRELQILLVRHVLERPVVLVVRCVHKVQVHACKLRLQARHDVQSAELWLYRYQIEQCAFSVSLLVGVELEVPCTAPTVVMPDWMLNLAMAALIHIKQSAMRGAPAHSAAQRLTFLRWLYIFDLEYPNTLPPFRPVYLPAC